MTPARHGTNVVECLHNAAEVYACSNHDGDVKDLVTRSKDIEAVRQPSLGDLSAVLVIFFRQKLPPRMSYPSGIYRSPDKIARTHPYHIVQGHAHSLQLPSMDVKAVGNENDGAQTKASVHACAPSTILW